MNKLYKNLNWLAWVKIFLVILYVFNLLSIVIPYIEAGLFDPMGLDFLAFWSAGKIAITDGFPYIYNLDRLAEVQYLAVSNPQVPFSQFHPVPSPLFPIFILPFALISHLNAPSSFTVWTILSTLLLIGYLAYFLKQTNPHGKQIHWFLILLISGTYAVVLNIYWGQVEVFLMIFAGEFTLAFIRRKPLLAGMWLAGMLLKPQILVLIIPWLLLARQWKVLWGFGGMAAVILGGSLLLSGVDGFTEVFRLWFQYVPGIYSNAPQTMINWRMPGIRLNEATSSNLGWFITGAGMLLTLLLTRKLIPSKPEKTSPEEMILHLTGVLAASLIFTWHSHMHMVMVLIPLLVYAWQQSSLPQTTIVLWMLLPAVLRVAVILFNIFLQISNLPTIEGLDGFVHGISGLLINVYLILKVLKYQNPIQTEAAPV